MQPTFETAGSLDRAPLPFPVRCRLATAGLIGPAPRSIAQVRPSGGPPDQGASR